MMKQRLAEYGMWAFIGTVIVAGLFGPWVMSVLLGGLAILCFQACYRHGPHERSF